MIQKEKKSKSDTQANTHCGASIQSCDVVSVPSQCENCLAWGVILRFVHSLIIWWGYCEQRQQNKNVTSSLSFSSKYDHSGV